MKLPISITATMVLAILAPVVATAAPTGSATVTLVTGRASVATPAGRVQRLSKHDGVEPGDTINTGPSSYVNLKFTDGGRILLRPNSRFQIAEYEYNDKPGAASGQADRDNVETRQGGNALFRLLKGGFRAVTGLIGKENRQNFKVRTPVATIGIRGTDFEARICSGDCFDVDPMPQDGLYAGVFEGGISLSNDAGTFDRDPGEFGFVSGADQPATPLPKRPKVLAADPIPDPEACGD